MNLFAEIYNYLKSKGYNRDIRVGDYVIYDNEMGKVISEDNDIIIIKFKDKKVKTLKVNVIPVIGYDELILAVKSILKPLNEKFNNAFNVIITETFDLNKFQSVCEVVMTLKKDNEEKIIIKVSDEIRVLALFKFIKALFEGVESLKALKLN